MMMSLRWAAALVLVMGCAPIQAEPQSGFAERWAVQPIAAATKKGAPPVSVEQALYLIRSSLLTLNDANRSGNYSVLRDLAAPDFQTRNSAADLALIFADLRARKFDLFAAALVAPSLTASPALDANRMLRLAGSFPTQPLRIDFNLLFQDVGGQWRLYGISVATPAAPQSAATQTQTTQQ